MGTTPGLLSRISGGRGLPAASCLPAISVQKSHRACTVIPLLPLVIPRRSSFVLVVDTTIMKGERLAWVGLTLWLCVWLPWPLFSDVVEVQPAPSLRCALGEPRQAFSSSSHPSNNDYVLVQPENATRDFLTRHCPDRKSTRLNSSHLA